MTACKRRVGASIAALLVFAFTAVGTVVAAETVKGPPVTWKYNVWGARRAFTAGIEYVSTYVADRTGGSFRIEIGYGEKLGSKLRNLENLKAGRFDMAQICTSYHPAKARALSVLNLPFLAIKDFKTQRRVHEAVYGHDIVRQEMAVNWSVMLYMSALLPQFEFLGKGDPPLTPTGWSGLTVRALGGLGDAMEHLGAKRNSDNASAVYAAMDRGAVDAVSFPFSYAHAAFGIHEVADWFTTNMSPGTVDCPAAISLASWNALPAPYRRLLAKAKPGAHKALVAAYRAADDENLGEFYRLMRPVTYSASQLDEFRERGGRPVHDAWVERHQDTFDARSLLDFVLKTASE